VLARLQPLPDCAPVERTVRSLPLIKVWARADGTSDPSETIDAAARMAACAACRIRSFGKKHRHPVASSGDAGPARVFRARAEEDRTIIGRTRQARRRRF